MNIAILGGGSFGTAFASQLSYNNSNKINIILRNEDVRDSINEKNINFKYFPDTVPKSV